MFLRAALSPFGWSPRLSRRSATMRVMPGTVDTASTIVSAEDRRPARIGWAFGIGPGTTGAVAVFATALVIYWLTLLPGPSVGDWAEMQWLPARLGIPHPTGYPLYVLLGKAFSLVPVGTLAVRAELLSAVAAAMACGTAVLIAIRLGVRTSLAIAAGLALAVTGELWLEATFSEMNGLHLLLMAAVIHRALVWRAERRDRDLLIGAFLAGLSLSNHVLAATVVPIVCAFVIVDARSRLREQPALLAKAAALVVVGLTPYLFIPIRALFGPAEIYGRFLTWDGFSGLVTGADLRSLMHFSSIDTLTKAWTDVPAVIGQLRDRSNVAFVAGAGIGLVVQLIRDRWLALMLLLIVAVNVYFFANYVGDLDHYLLVTWLAATIWLAIALEAAFGWLDGHVTAVRIRPGLAALALALPIAIGAGNWAASDQSRNHDGEAFADSVFAALPRNAVLVTYWDALTTLGYEHCVDGRRPDVAMRAFDVTARVVCDPVEGTLEDVAAARPLFALFVTAGELNGLRGSFVLVPGPTLAVPYGKRGLDHQAVLYRLEPRT
jgi:transmembrane protein TMEM260 (protein O-mannosyltransferase)